MTIRRVSAFVLLIAVSLLAVPHSHAGAREERRRATICHRNVRARGGRKTLERFSRRRRSDAGAGAGPDDELAARVRDAIRDAADLRERGETRFRQLSLELEDAGLRWLDDPATVTAAEWRDLEDRVMRAGQSRITAFGVDQYADRRARRVQLLRDLQNHAEIASLSYRPTASLPRSVNRRGPLTGSESPAMSAAARAEHATRTELIARNIRRAIAASAPPLNTQRGVAVALGRTEVEVSRWANGTRQPTYHMNDLERVFDKPAGWFFSEHPDPEAPE